MDKDTAIKLALWKLQGFFLFSILYITASFPSNIQLRFLHFHYDGLLNQHRLILRFSYGIKEDYSEL